LLRCRYVATGIVADIDNDVPASNQILKPHETL